MKIIDKIVGHVGTDKVLHFLCGALIAAQFEIFAWWWMLVAIVLVGAISFAKEKWLDESFDVNDIVAAILGAFVELWSLVIRMWLFSEVPFGGFN